VPGRPSVAPNVPFLTASPGLPRKRKNTEPSNLSATVSKKQRVDPIDVHQLDGPKGLSLRTVLAPPPSQAAPTHSSSKYFKQDIRSASIALAPQAPVPRSHRPKHSPTASTSCAVPQPGYGITGGNSLAFPAKQEALGSAFRGQRQLFSSDLQSNPTRPPTTTPRIVPKPGNLPIKVIDLSLSEDEGPMENDRSTGGRDSQTEAQGLENVAPRTEEESDSDYWSNCLSDDGREEPSEALYPVNKVQPTHIQKGWIPPVSSFAMTLHEFPINIVYLDFHRTPPSS
jgi:hypothetical protein